MKWDDSMIDQGTREGQSWLGLVEETGTLTRQAY